MNKVISILAAGLLYSVSAFGVNYQGLSVPSDPAMQEILDTWCRVTGSQMTGAFAGSRIVRVESDVESSAESPERQNADVMDIREIARALLSSYGVDPAQEPRAEQSLLKAFQKMKHGRFYLASQDSDFTSVAFVDTHHSEILFLYAGSYSSD